MIRALVPVNLRPLEKAYKLGNQFGLVFLDLPIGIENPVERLYAVRANMRALKGSYQPVLALGLLAAMGAGPEGAAGRAAESARAQRDGGHDQRARSAAAALARRRARSTSLMFWVPQSGDIGMGVSILSYNGTVQFGVVTDRGLCPDPGAHQRAVRRRIREARAGDADGAVAARRRPGSDVAAQVGRAAARREELRRLTATPDRCSGRRTLPSGTGSSAPSDPSSRTTARRAGESRRTGTCSISVRSTSRSNAGLVLAQHDRVRLDRQVLADDGEVVGLRRFRDEAVEQHVVHRERDGPAVGDRGERSLWSLASRIVSFSTRSSFICRIIFSLVVPFVTTTVLPRRSSTLLMFDDFCASILMPATNVVYANATSFWRSRVLVVEPHSRSTLPSLTIAIRFADVTGRKRTSRRGSLSSLLIASATLRHRSTE